MKKLFNLSFFYLILGLALGVFFREFTKFNNFTGITKLSSAHTHTLVARGILEVLNKDFIGLPHIAGTAHTILGISLIWFIILLKKSLFTK